MDYDTLVASKATAGSIRSWVNYDPTPAEDVLEDAQAYIYGALRTREMRTLAPFQLAAGSPSINLPPRHVETISLKDTLTGEELEASDEKRLSRQMQFNPDGTLVPGEPAFWAAYSNRWQFDVAAATARTIVAFYYVRPDLLGPGNQTNFLTDRYPGLLRAACNMHAADFRQDDANYTRWKARTDELLAKITVENKLDLPEAGADLDTAFQEITNWGRVPSRAVLRDAESYIYGVLRAREMLKTYAFPLAVGDDSATLPPGYLEPMSLTDQEGCPLDLRPEQAFLREDRIPNSDGTMPQGWPQSYTVYDERIMLDCAAQSDMILSFLHYARPAPLGPQNPSNFLTERYPNLLRAACRMMLVDPKDANAFQIRKGVVDEALVRANVEADGRYRGMVARLG